MQGSLKYGKCPVSGKNQQKYGRRENTGKKNLVRDQKTGKLSCPGMSGIFQILFLVIFYLFIILKLYLNSK